MNLKENARFWFGMSSKLFEKKRQSEASPTHPSWVFAKYLFKIAISSLGIWLAVRLIDREDLRRFAFDIPGTSWCAAMILYNASRLLAMQRLRTLVRAEGFFIGVRRMSWLTYRSAFYGIFLPGGFSGDGYKAWVLSREEKMQPSQLVRVLIFDRASGMIAILSLVSCLGVVFCFSKGWWLTGIVSSAASTVVLTCSSYLRSFLPARLNAILPKAHLGIVILYSISIQIVQLAAASFFYFSLHGEPGQWLLFSALFMMSSLAAFLPLSLGGLGLRELVFVMALPYWSGANSTMLMVSLAFSAVATASNLIGAVWPK